MALSASLPLLMEERGEEEGGGGGVVDGGGRDIWSGGEQFVMSAGNYIDYTYIYVRTCIYISTIKYNIHSYWAH